MYTYFAFDSQGSFCIDLKVFQKPSRNGNINGIPPKETGIHGFWHFPRKIHIFCNKICIETFSKTRNSLLLFTSSLSKKCMTISHRVFDVMQIWSSHANRFSDKLLSIDCYFVAKKLLFLVVAMGTFINYVDNILNFWFFFCFTSTLWLLWVCFWYY